MNEYLILATSQDAYHKADFHSSVVCGEYDGSIIFKVMNPTDPTRIEDQLIGGCAPGSIPLPGFDFETYQLIRPLGNHEDGTATGILGYSGWAGWPPRKLGDPVSEALVEQLYPQSVLPFDAECRPKYFDTPATPASTGWGFRYELVGRASYRDPTARAIGVYSDAECTQYLWTTGALQLGPSDWQVDGQGNPLEVWYTDSWDGDRPPEKKDWHIAVLLGSAQEGHATLKTAAESVRYLFWEFDQGYEPPPAGQWVDTGATIIAQAGTVYRISDAAVAAALIPGQAIRLGDTAETTFTGVWAGGADYIEIDPFVQAAVGDVVWAWQ